MARWFSWLERRPVTAEVVGSSPIRVVHDLVVDFFDYFMYYIFVVGVLAQLGEHLPYKQGVTGSSPVASTIYFADIAQLVEQLICNQ